MGQRDSREKTESVDRKRQKRYAKRDFQLRTFLKDKRLGNNKCLSQKRRKAMYFMLDNYDSFVYNLSAYFEELGQKILVKRADQITVAEVEELQPEGIIISPGPGKPSEAHLSHALLERFAGEIPILGVCLGHQVIVEKYHGRVEKGTRPMHGKVTPITHTGEGIFRGLPETFSVTRYHSLAAEGELPACLKVTARSQDGAIMAVEHQSFPVYGVQFHPEAVLSEYGHELLENFVKISEEWRERHAADQTA